MLGLHDRVERILPLVQNPAQYVGGEWNVRRKEITPDTLRIVFAFPDTYAIGMSHVGLQILYHVLNDLEGVSCERAFMPWSDMEHQLRTNDIPLFSLETFTPLSEFDVVAFSLQYELTCTNVLAMLDLGGVPVLSAERTPDDPWVIAGGPGALNPEPLADFIDLFVVGDGEETAPLLARTLHERKDSGPFSRREVLLELARASASFYVPTLYDVPGDGGALRPTDTGVPFPITAAAVNDLDAAPFPTRPIVPNTEVVHDRIAIEIMRGCPHHCRFCQAGRARRPLRLRSVEKIVQLARDAYGSTGCDELALTSLSSNDYPHLDRLLAKLDAQFRPLGVSLSVPSLRLSENLMRLPELLGRVRKSGLTYAPEAASTDLAEIIGKHVVIDDLLAGVREAYAAGWDLVKLYYMVGLPGETDADVDAIVRLTRTVSDLRREFARGPAKVNVTVAPFIPKPHTPLQWEPMAPVAYLEGVREKLKKAWRRGRIRLKFHDIRRSLLEAAFSRGDRRLGKVLLEAYRRGARLDAWDEHFRADVWDDAFKACDIDPLDYSHRRRAEEEVLPWSHIDVGLPPDDLLTQKRHVEKLIGERS
ncbi:MAG TPA: TIGR03960 family B12-binding radical SAM protein [Planctomycetota bacterium]|nr:TIGR03960 family B12-binding radical SAM protein [Planctomycetota bacterium]